MPTYAARTSLECRSKTCSTHAHLLDTLPRRARLFLMDNAVPLLASSMAKVGSVCTLKTRNQLIVWRIACCEIKERWPRAGIFARSADHIRACLQARLTVANRYPL